MALFHGREKLRYLLRPISWFLESSAIYIVFVPVLYENGRDVFPIAFVGIAAETRRRDPQKSVGGSIGTEVSVFVLEEAVETIQNKNTAGSFFAVCADTRKSWWCACRVLCCSDDAVMT